MNKIRSTALRARRKMSVDDRVVASEIICDRVINSRAFLAAQLVACYLPMNDEVDTRLIIERCWRANKRIFVPIIQNKQKMSFREIRPDTTLRRNRMSIWEPESGHFIAPRQLQIIITPTVAFDENNHRIGMGGGYYDRCFSFLRHRKQWVQPKLFGVAFACQKVERISPNSWDIRLYRTFSETN